MNLRSNIKVMTGYIPGFQPEEAGWIKLNQNENPYSPSPKALAAIREAASNVRIYPDSQSTAVREAAAHVYDVDADEVLVTTGSDEMLRILLQACAGNSDEVVAFYPSYTYYKTLAEIQNASFRLIEFDENYQLPAAMDLQNAKLVFLPNPNAPSGTGFSLKDLARLCDETPNGLVVADEAYIDFADCASAISMIRTHANLVVTRTFSKSYSLAGLRLGLGFTHRELIAQLDKVRDFYNVDCIAQAAAEAALLDQDYLRRIVARIKATRTRLCAGLDRLGIEYIPSETNFVLARFTSPSAKDVYDQLFARKILVRYFDKPRLAGCLRITIGTEEETGTLLDALATILGTTSEAE